VEASATSICAGEAVHFKVTPIPGISDPVYQWLVNGASAGGDSTVFNSGSLQDGDVVLCRVSGNFGCAVGSSPDIGMTVYPLPTVAPMADIVLPAGQSITLIPVVTGDISRYSWSPGASLSDSMILDPLASPVKTTLYTLTVTAAGKCVASGTVKVIVFTNLRIPAAFSPNGDGKNDVFYVLGGPAGSMVGELSVYDRWGQRVFGVHDVAPGEAASGWNGTIGGAPAPTGTYVYSLLMRFADGTRQWLQGTVVLVR